MIENQQFEGCRHIVDHIRCLLSDTENLKLIVKSKVYEQSERHGFCCSDVLYVLANIEFIQDCPPGYQHENCYLVSGTTIDEIRMSIVLVTSEDSMRIKILTVWPE